MQEFRGKVAVVTGAASGIGRALAERCAREGMKVVLADVEEPALMQTAAALEATGASVLAVPDRRGEVVRCREPGPAHRRGVRRRAPAVQQRRRRRRWTGLGEHRRRLAVGAWGSTCGA